MKNIIQDFVAEGIIGQYNISWHVLRMRDIKNNSECYDLYIGHEHIKTCDSVKESLKVLIDQFEE